MRHDDDRPRADQRRASSVRRLVAAGAALLVIAASAATVSSAATPAATPGTSTSVVAPARDLTAAEALAAQRARQQRATAALARAVAAAKARALRSKATSKARFNPGPFGSGLLGDYSTNAVIRRTGCLTAEPGRRVVIVGDSLTTRTRSAIDVRMAEAGLPFCLNAQGGRPTRPTVDALFALPRASVDAIVVASGSNDVFSPLVMTREIDRVMSYADGAPVFWVTVYVDRWAQATEVRRADQRNTATVNSLLGRAAARHPNLVVVDWYGFLTRVYGRAATYLIDGVHTNTTGTDARALLLTRALLAHFGPPPPPPPTADPSVTPTCDSTQACATAPTTTGPTTTGPTTTAPTTTGPTTTAPTTTAPTTTAPTTTAPTTTAPTSTTTTTGGSPSR